jgi:iron complex transport system substrate-binding protein
MQPQRIASMLASATEIVAALGLEDRLVAISHECDYPPHVLDRPRASRPRFDPAGLASGAIDQAVRDALAEHGSVYALDTGLLQQLRPDLILTQAVCDVCAVPTAGVREAAAACALDAEVLSLDAHTVAGILDTIDAVGLAAGVESAAADVRAAIERRLEAVRSAVAAAPRPRVLAVEWLDPPFLPGHWLPEMVVLAGGENVRGEAGARSEQTTWDALAGLDPDVLLIMPCGYGLAESIADTDRHAERLLALAPRAVEAGAAFVVDGSSYFNRSGPRFVDGVEILGGLLHPDRLPAPSPATAAVWRPASR